MSPLDEPPTWDQVRGLVYEVALLRGVTPAVVCVSRGLPITCATPADDLET